MNFTEDWFTHNIPNFQKCLDEMVGKRKNFLEIGCYEGRSTCWFIEKIDVGGSVTSIDTFGGGQEHDGVNFKEVENRFLANVKEAVGDNEQISIVMKDTSYNALAQLIEQKKEFDFIYIDGSHTAYDTLSDACMAWGILRSGGVVLFDDYEWNKYPEPELNPKLGIDSFLACYVGQYDLLFKNYQLAVRKK